MPPPGMPPGPPPFSSFSLISETMASVVSIRPAIDAALSSAVLVTLAGSMTPAATRSSNLPVAALKPLLPLVDRSSLDDDRALLAGVDGDLAGRLLERAADDVDADLHVALGLDAFDGLDGAQQGDAAAGDDPLLDGRLGGVHGVLDAGLLLLHLGLGRGADLDHRDAADELGQALLELLAVVVRGGLLDLVADLLDAAGDGLTPLGVVRVGDDGGLVLVDDDLLGVAQVLPA